MKKTLQEALKAIEEKVFPIENTEIRKTKDCLGYLAGEDIHCPIDIPSFDRSAFDGYAVALKNDISKEENIPQTFLIKDASYAGDHPEEKLYPGEAYRTATGAMLPPGADFIIRSEDSHAEGNQLTVNKPLSPKAHIMTRGEDVEKGEVLIEKGEYLDSYLLSILHSAGVGQVRVYRKPKILIFTTGNELVNDDAELKPGQIYNSNIPFLLYRLREWGYDADDVGIVPDVKKDIQKLLESKKKEYDLIITSGGMSIGDRDFMPSLMLELEGNVAFHGLHLKPGQRMALFRLGATDVLSLAGNPFAFVVGVEILLRHVLLAITKNKRLEPKSTTLTLDSEVKNKGESLQVIRGKIQNGRFLPSKKQLSSVMSEFRNTNGFFLLQPRITYQAGENIQVYPFRSQDI
ncbi:MAG: molybdopterin molybdotransferase MoeA [Tissierellia bacterium]|nr:molybdopterin molybdotransferase MoeA [Tissierellia bacterium]